MRVGRLKELLENIPDEVEVFVRNSVKQEHREREDKDPRLKNDQGIRGRNGGEFPPKKNEEPPAGDSQELRGDSKPAPKEGGISRLTGRLDPGPRRERKGLSIQALSELLPNSLTGLEGDKAEEGNHLGETIVIDTAEVNLNINGQKKGNENGNIGNKKASEEMTSLDELLGLDSFEDLEDEEKPSQNKKAGSSKKKNRGGKRKGQK